MAVEPIKPSEVVERKLSSLPDFVITSFNELIAENWSGSESKFPQKDVINRITSKMDIETMRQERVFQRGWLDVEEVYRNAGWIVEYDKAGYCETYDSFFIFRKQTI